MAIILYKIDVRKTIDSFHQVNYVYLIPAMFFYLATLWIRALRWQIILYPLKKVPLNSSFSINMVGYMTNNLLRSDGRISELKTRGFEFDVELLWRLKKKGYKIIEYPITWMHSGGSTFSLLNAPKMFLSLIKVRIWK